MDRKVQGAFRMYRHILVPIDDSPLSVDTVQQAVVFARAIGAKVTFFHAQPTTPRRASARSSA